MGATEGAISQLHCQVAGIEEKNTDANLRRKFKK